MNRAEYIQGLRDIADFFEARPDLPVPEYGHDFVIWERSITTTHDRAIQMAPCEKRYLGDQFFELQREFGPHRLQVTWNRNDVCERKQVGTKWVEESVIPAHAEPVYEWDCSKPILGSSSDEDNQLTQGDNAI